MDAKLLRAARAYTGWTQAELAEKARLAPRTISCMEAGEHSITLKSAQKLETAFRRMGVILNGTGFEIREADIEILTGDDWYLRLLDDVYYTLMDKGGELIVDMGDDRLSPPDVVERYRMIRRTGVTMRQSVEEGNSYLMGPVSEYRWIPRDNFQNWVTLIYGDCVAISLENESKCVLFRDKNIAKTERNKFNLIWNLLPPVDVESTANVRF